MAVIIVFLLFSAAAQADVAGELIAAINKCAAIPDEEVRHSCYDRLPAVVKTLVPAAQTNAQTVAAAPVAAPITTSAAIPAKKEGGLASLFGTPGSDPMPGDYITATVESFTFDYGVFVLTLDNGQVWRQVAAVGDIIHFSKDRKDHVMIWRNSFGVYVLKIEGFRTEYHVRRIK